MHTTNDMHAPPDETAFSSHHTLMNVLGLLVDESIAANAEVNRAPARRAKTIDDARVWCEFTHGLENAPRTLGWSPEVTCRRVLESELAAALHVPERTMSRLIDESEALLHQLPGTYGALSRGTLSYRHAQVIIDQALSLPAESRVPFEEAVLPDAETLTVSKLERRARRLRELTHPESIQSRRVRAELDRSVELKPAHDGMSWLTAYVPCERAHAVYNRLSDIARGLQTADESRTLSQLIADVALDLLENSEPTLAGATQGIRPTVLVTVPALTLLGMSDEPATLEGYGPIDADTARRVAAHAPSFFRLLTHPETGTVLSVGRDHYEVPVDLRRWLRVRDETCRAPGCNRLARRCDCDHCTDWNTEGLTAHDNLAHLCRRHHSLKHRTGWSYVHRGGGTLEFTSPTKKNYVTHPAVKMKAAPTM
ncbi:HNH endonuclease signature motif containing protein [Agreia bicolorata]|uniref:HNH endonuclease signature motif containing protein n=1 Tax=Agreia bicolorata TaxID=110935 RepID=UPI000697F587|nr:HNH endonuclease signature motif containing protein [Agreia bicolorata]